MFRGASDGECPAYPGTLFEPDQYRPATVTPARTVTLDIRAAILVFRADGVWQFWVQVFQFTGTDLADMNVARVA
jgi:hypothetical protein